VASSARLSSQSQRLKVDIRRRVSVGPRWQLKNEPKRKSFTIVYIKLKKAQSPPRVLAGCPASFTL